MATVPRVVVVEDEPDIAALIKHTLERSGDAFVETVGRGDEAFRLITARPPDLVVLDLNLPVLSGDDICRLIRQRSDTRDVPIIVLTARTSESDRISGFDLGADDYVTKPFSPRELRARVRAVLRRSGQSSGAAAHGRQASYRGTHLAADFDAVKVDVDGEAVRLTRREFELLRFLVEHRNRVVSRNSLLEQVWGFERPVDTRSVDVHVGRLRSKLGAAGDQIETLIGFGYRFNE